MPRSAVDGRAGAASIASSSSLMRPRSTRRALRRWRITLTATRWSQVPNALPAEGSDLLPDPDEDVLGDFVSVLGAQHPAAQSEDAAHVRPVKAFEGPRVAALCPRDIGSFSGRRKRVPQRRRQRIHQRCRRGHPGLHERFVQGVGRGRSRWLERGTASPRSLRREARLPPTIPGPRCLRGCRTAAHPGSRSCRPGASNRASPRRFCGGSYRPSPSIRFPRPPRIDPSSCRRPPVWGAAA